jgi:HEAT repeat protein
MASTFPAKTSPIAWGKEIRRWGLVNILTGVSTPERRLKAADALGKLGVQSAVAPLYTALKSVDVNNPQLTRLHYVAALKNLGGATAKANLTTQEGVETDPVVLAAIVAAVAVM